MCRLFALFLLIGAGCATDAPLPPPSNPAAQSLSCVINGCPGAEICHAAVGGGFCAPACTDDGACAALGDGLVCHPHAGGICAPDCAAGGAPDDAVCTAYGSALVCNADGRCHDDAPARLATLRAFNGVRGFAHVNVAVDDGGVTLNDIAPGAFAVLTDLAPGSHTLAFTDDQGAALTTATFTAEAGKRYFAVVVRNSELTNQYSARVVLESASALPTQASAGLRYLHMDPLLTDQDVALSTGSDRQLLVGAVATLGVSDLVATSARAGELQIGPAGTPDDVLMRGSLTFAAGEIYTVITWLNAAFVPETVVLDSHAVVARYAAAGVRLANATTDVANLQIDIDDHFAVGTSNVRTLAPLSQFSLLEPGTHHVQVKSGATAIYDDMLTLDPGASYTFIASGNVADVGSHLSVTLVPETLPAPIATTSARIQAMHAASNKTSDTVTFTGFGANLASSVAYLVLPPAVIVAKPSDANVSAQFTSVSKAVTAEYDSTALSQVTTFVIATVELKPPPATENVLTLWTFDPLGTKQLFKPH